QIQALAAHDIVVAGSVPLVQPWLDRAFATAIPLRAGSGTRIKILEAWAAGVPVVASRIAAEGLPYTGGKDLLLAEEPSEFASARAEPAGTRIPAPPASSSGNSPTALATTQRPSDIASSATSGRPSVSDGSATTSAAAKIGRVSSTNPRKRASRPWAAARSSSRSGP